MKQNARYDAKCWATKEWHGKALHHPISCFSFNVSSRFFYFAILSQCDLCVMFRNKSRCLRSFQIQDFRFLCPNGNYMSDIYKWHVLINFLWHISGTAFDQEAQICADWGDVDCENLYDNFDLYRLGSTFESKKSKVVEEDESVFHLQRAETSLNKIIMMTNHNYRCFANEKIFQATLDEASSILWTSRTRFKRQDLPRHSDLHQRFRQLPR